MADKEVSEPIHEKNTNINVLSLASGGVFNSTILSKVHDYLLMLFCLFSIMGSIFQFIILDSFCASGYLFSGIFSGYSLYNVKKGRLNLEMQKSVNTLKLENDELKENNDELKENIDELENIHDNLKRDLDMFKKTIGIFGTESEDILENLKKSYKKYEAENNRQEKISDNMIYINILDIIKHHDSNTDYLLDVNELQNAKETLLNSFPKLNYDKLIDKIKGGNINAKNIMECIDE